MALLRYTALRALVLGVVLALLWLVGLRGFVLLLSALLISGIVSLFVLSRSRDAVSASLDHRLSTIKERTQAEDAWDDARREQTSETEPADQDDR